MSEIYFSTDIESDGPIPGEYSMFAFGCVPILENGTVLNGRGWNLKPLEGAKQHPSTMEFWNLPDNKPVYKRLHEAQFEPEDAMVQFSDWVKKLAAQYEAKPVFVAYPAGFDFMFILWYLNKFVGDSVFSHSALDMKTAAWAWFNRDFRKVTKTFLKQHWPSDYPHDHDPVNDARQQAEIFSLMLKHRQKVTS